MRNLGFESKQVRTNQRDLPAFHFS